jgi:hypothetical protein
MSRTIQLIDGQWQKLGAKGLHECCDCALVHEVSYAVQDGVLYERWRRSKKETVKARKKKSK